MLRILVTGNAGSGKTSVAQALASHKDLPYVGLDSIVWKPRWIMTPKLQRKEKESALANKSSWVVDGVSLTFLEAADTIVFLDYKRSTCLLRALRRNVRYLFRSRPGLPEHCPEISIFPTLLKIIWQFPTRVRPKILEFRHHSDKTFVHIRNDIELTQFISSVGASWPNNAPKLTGHKAGQQVG